MYTDMVINVLESQIPYLTHVVDVPVVDRLVIRGRGFSSQITCEIEVLGKSNSDSVPEFIRYGLLYMDNARERTIVLEEPPDQIRFLVLSLTGVLSRLQWR